jgi:hypothetical protein
MIAMINKIKSAKTAKAACNIIAVWIILAASLFSCREEERGQYPVDSAAPEQVNVTDIRNFRGGATLVYSIPTDKDFLYVKAIYRLPNGQEKQQMSSASSITIKGFAKSGKTDVELISVDRSRNESRPVRVEIEPLDSPIFEVLDSLAVSAAFGGIRLAWKNTAGEDIVIGVLYRDDENRYATVENIYTSLTEGVMNIRNLPSVETDFAFFVRDIYGNYSDTLFLPFTPWKEELLDKKLWQELPLCSSFSISAGSGWSGPMSKLWDGVTVAGLGNIYYLDRSESIPIFFTFDLGVSAKLSRFTFWGRSEWYFNLHHPKEIEIWGTDDPVIANGNACSWDGWNLLLSCTSTKPSGNEPLANAELTAEDRARAAAGEEFEFPLDIPFTRYIRFRCLRTWTDSQNLFLGELSFWGENN